MRQESAKAARDAANRLLAETTLARISVEILETIGKPALELVGTEVKSNSGGKGQPARMASALIAAGEGCSCTTFTSPKATPGPY